MSEEISYFDRYTGSVETEQIYGEKFLRWAYESLPGRAALAAVVKRAWFSRWYGWRMDRPVSKSRIEPFIKEYGLDPDEFERELADFASFNEFFYRKLKPSARPLDSHPESMLFPADGRHLGVQDISECDGLLVKGEMFRLEELLASAKLAERYAKGSLVLSRLCPVDYHRFHFPWAGTPGEAKLLNGPLLSVNPIALCQNIGILATNKRAMTFLETESLGRVIVMEIGATCVGSICQTFVPGKPVAKGDEKGYFRFGGSSTIMLFEPGRVILDDDLIANSLQNRELYAHVGDRMGRILS